MYKYINRDASGNVQFITETDRFQRLSERAGEVIYRCELSPHLHLSYVSPSSTVVVGYDPQEFYADPGLLQRIIHPDDYSFLQDLLEGDTAWDEPLILRVTRRDGVTIWMEDLVMPVQDDDGQLVALEGIARNITTRKEAEEAYQVLVKHSLQGLILFQDGRIIFANPYAAEMSGYTEAELLAMTEEDVVSMVHPEGRQAFRLRLHDRITGKRSDSRGEIQFIRRDGEIRQMEAYVSLIRFRGRPTLQAAFIDITERRDVEERLRESEEKYRSLFRTIVEGFALHEGIYDEEGRLFDFRYLDVNPAFENLVHVPRDHLVGKTVREVFPESAPFWVSIARPVLSGGEPHRILHYSNTAGRHLDYTIFSPKPGQFATLLHDITDFIHSEETLERYAEDLRHSNEDLMQFTHTASHDLKEPLRAIVCFTQLLDEHCRGELDSEAERYIRNIVEAGNRMYNLIDDLLRYSLLARADMALQEMESSIALEQAIENLQVQIAESCATITRDPLPRILGDASQLTLVFQHLISNAMKFQKEYEKPRIHVSATRFQEFWRFSVHDNGIGIPPDCLDKIFLIFERLQRWDAYPGTGMGLALCKRIVERHGGHIWAESREPEGSTFYFTLKAADNNPP